SSTMRFYRLVFRHVLLLNLYELLSLMKYQVKLVMRKLRALARGPHAIQNGRYRRSIYAAQGACLIFTREYFERGGSLRYGSFLFYEEIFVAETAREIGVDIVYEPTLRVWHDDHASTGFPRSRKMTKYFGDSAKYVADRYFS